MLSSQIFKAYDIRGLYPQEFDAEGAALITAAFLHWLAQRNLPRGKIVLAYDARPSSVAIAEAVRSVLAAERVSVLDIGLATTPLYYFAINHLEADAGMMITASHNPAQFNGIKLNIRGALSVAAGTGLEEIRDLALKPNVRSPTPHINDVIPSEARYSTVSGEARNLKGLPTAYLNYLLALVPPDRIKPMRIAIDNGNGMCGLLLPELLARLPQLTVERLYFEPDGTFPNHEANPLKEETLRDLKNVVAEKRCALGVAFDGDGDRVGFVTKELEHVRGDFITALLAQHLLSNLPISKSANLPIILYEVRSSRIVPEVISASGGEPILVPPGHAKINRIMVEHGALFGGELSGHYFFKDFYGRESALLAFLRVLEVVSQTGKSLSDILAPLKKYSHSGEINFEVGDKQRLMTKIEAHFSEGAIQKIDGLTIAYPDWWFNLRPSNTEDLLRLNLEADTRELMEEKLALLRELIDTQPIR